MLSKVKVIITLTFDNTTMIHGLKDMLVGSSINVVVYFSVLLSVCFYISSVLVSTSTMMRLSKQLLSLNCMQPVSFHLSLYIFTIMISIYRPLLIPVFTL